MSVFKYSEKHENETVYFRFEGIIDEDSKMPPPTAIKYKNIIINLKKIKSINSIGIREWMRWIGAQNTAQSISLIECPKAMVFQMNMISGFVPANAKVESFFVPLFCEKCEKESERLLTVGQDVVLEADGNIVINESCSEDTISLDACTDSACGMLPDYKIATYMAFLKIRK